MIAYIHYKTDVSIIESHVFDNSFDYFWYISCAQYTPPTEAFLYQLSKHLINFNNHRITFNNHRGLRTCPDQTCQWTGRALGPAEPKKQIIDKYINVNVTWIQIFNSFELGVIQSKYKR